MPWMHPEKTAAEGRAQPLVTAGTIIVTAQIVQIHIQQGGIECLGLSEGERPNFLFRGYWLYLGGIPVVHLVEAADKAGAWNREIVIPDAANGTGAFDHVAFRGDDPAVLKARLQKAGMTFRERLVPGGAVEQIFVPDPEGVLVEINFRR